MPWWSRFVVDGQCVPFSNSTHRGRIVLSCCASIDHFVVISRDSAGELVLTGPANSDACLPDGKSTKAVVQWLGIKANMDQVSWLGKFMGRSDVETWCTVFGAASVYLFNASAAEFSWKLPRRGEDLLTDYEVTAMFQWSRTLVSTLVS
jgi:hypothetical protein